MPVVWFAPVRPRVIIPVPEVELEKLPAAPLPAAARPASAVSGRFDGARLHMRAAGQHYNPKQQYVQPTKAFHGNKCRAIIVVYLENYSLDSEGQKKCKKTIF
jgi:hypothetical protein